MPQGSSRFTQDLSQVHTGAGHKGFQATVPGKLQLIREPVVCSKVSLSRATVRRLVKNKIFPAPYSLGGRRVAWAVHEVDAWIAARMERTEVAAA